MRGWLGPVLMALALAAGCGQKGPLVLRDAHGKTAVPATAPGAVGTGAPTAPAAPSPGSAPAATPESAPDAPKDPTDTPPRAPQA